MQRKWLIIPSVCTYCMCCLSERTVAGLPVLPSVKASEICILAHGVLSSAMLRRGPCAHACRAGEDVFHTRGDRRREGAPREPVRGDRRRAVLDSFKQLQIDFQAKRICIRKTVLRAI